MYLNYCSMNLYRLNEYKYLLYQFERHFIMQTWIAVFFVHGVSYWAQWALSREEEEEEMQHIE